MHWPLSVCCCCCHRYLNILLIALLVYNSFSQIVLIFHTSSKDDASESLSVKVDVQVTH